MCYLNQEQMSVFAMNGFGDLQSFCEIREADLDYMGIMAPEQRAKILAAVQVMHDYQCEYLYSLILRSLSSLLLYAASIDIVIVIISSSSIIITNLVLLTAPEDDSSSTEENKTDPSCDDSQEAAHSQRAIIPGADVAKSKLTPKPRFSANNGNDATLSSPEYGKKAPKSGDTANTSTAAKPNSCTSSEKSSDSGVSTSSSVCFGNMTRGKRSGATHQLNGKNNFGGHLVQQNVKD